MPRRLILSLVALSLLGARKADDPKHENHYAAQTAPVVDGLSIELSSVESQRDFVKLGAKLSNKTTDRVFVLRKESAEFVLPAGTRPVKPPGILTGATMVLEPGKSASNTWTASGDTGDYHVDSFSFAIKGLTSAANKGTALTAPEFQMPPSLNTLSVGAFECNLTDNRQNTDDAYAVFQCTYGGTGLGIIDQRRIGARSKNGTEYANLTKNAARDILLPGDKAKFSVWIKIPAKDADMQFVPFQLLFRDAFSESTTTAVTVDPWTFQVDAAKTADANK